MLRILFAENGILRWYLPVYSKTVVKDAYTSVSLRVIEVVALVLEHCRFRQYSKTVGEASRNKELAVVVLCQLYGNVLTVCLATLADINSHVKDGAFHATYQLALCVRGTLEMQAAHYAIA